MPTSSANVNPGKLQLTPMRVTFKGVDLGGTLGNATITTTLEKAELMADQLGKTVIDRRISAVKISVETELAEVIDKSKWAVVFPSQKSITQGPDSAFYFDSQIGSKDSDHAGLLSLHPLANINSNLSEDYTFWKAVSSEDSSIVYGPDEQARLKITWNILPDFTSSPPRFYIYGDPGLGPVEAQAGTPVFTGTGDGTLTDIELTSDSVSETIIASCIAGATDGGTFLVSGTQSGVLGAVTLPGIPGGSAQFSSPVIGFVITDGATDFDEGDFFSISITGPNYV